MTERDQITEQERDPLTDATGQRGNDDRRAPVDPTEKRVPNSPQPDHEAVRKGEDTLERVKPY